MEHRALFRPLIGLWISVLFGMNTLVGQSVIFLPHEDVPTVCQEHVQRIVIQNNEGTPIPGPILVTFQLPCGMDYLQGSVSGAMEESLADLQNPVFVLPGLSPGESQMVKIRVAIKCDALPCLNLGLLYTTSVLLEVNGTVEDPYQSNQYPVETPYLVITKVTKTYLEATQGQTLTRTLVVRNTRSGRLSGFLFTDDIPVQLDITSSDGSDAGSTPQQLRRSFGPADFALIGNKDGFFNFNEELIIKETILVNTCSFDGPDAASTIRVSWGCDNTVCQEAKVNTLVYIEPLALKGRIDSIFLQTRPATCYAGQLNGQSWSVKNTSSYSTIVDGKLGMAIDDPAVFLMVDSVRVRLNGQLVQATIKANSIWTTACNGKATDSLAILLPPIPPGQTLRVEFDFQTCSTEECYLQDGNWRWAFNYEKSCAAPGDQFFENADTVFNESELFLGGIYFDGKTNESVMNGQVLDLPLTIPKGLPAQDGTKWEAWITLPCGLELKNTTFNIGTIQPLSTTITPLANGTLIHLEYPFPLPVGAIQIPLKVQMWCDSICIGLPCAYSLETSCEMDCGGPAALLRMQGKVRFSFEDDCPELYSPSLCTERILFVDCQGAPCPDTLTVYHDHTLTIERTSLGLPDNDNNYQPDPGGQLDMAKIRLDRAMPGDTVRLVLDGVVRSDVQGDEFESIRFKVKFGYGGGIVTTPGKEDEAFYKLLTGIQNIGNTMRVMDQSTGKKFEVPVQYSFIPQDSTLWLSIHFDTLAAMYSQVPKGFRIAHMDSLRLECRFLMKVIYRSTPVKYAVKLLARSNVFIYNGDFTEEIERRVCPCPNDRLEYSSITDQYYTPLITKLPLCMEENKMTFGVEYGVIPNFFPYEYRSVMDSILKVCFVMEDFQIDSILMSGFKVNNNPDVLTSILLPGSEVVPGRYCVEVNPFVLPLWEEAFRFDLDIFQHSLLCERQGESQKAKADIQFAPYASRWKSGVQSIAPGLKYFWERTVPTFRIEACNQTFFSDTARWDFEISNCSFNTSYVADMPNAWVKVKFTNQSLSGLTLRNEKTGLEYPYKDGRFLLGTVGICDTLNLALTALNSSCEEEQLQLLWGWSCDSTDLDVTCWSKEDTCTFSSPPGVLGMQPSQDTLSAPLCTPMPLSHSIHFNAENGKAYDLQVIVTLPQGLSYIPGTAQIEWPENSGQFWTAVDPDMLPDGRLVWALDSLVSGLANGLPGQQNLPYHSLVLTFQTHTDCGFISGSQLIYTFRARKVCDDPTNTVAKPSGPYTVSGIEPPYHLDLSVQLKDTVSCQSDLAVTVKVNTSMITTDSAFLTVETPVGMSYVGGSAETNLAISEPDITGNRLIWSLDPNVPNTELKIYLSVDTDIPCGPVLLPIYTSVQAKTLCDESGEDCAIEVITGVKHIPLIVARPTYTITSVEAVPYLDGQGVEVRIIQTGGDTPGNGEVDLYVDADGNGEYSTDDILVGTKSFAFTTSGLLTLIFGPLDLDKNDWCRLIAVIDVNKNCICYPVDKVIQVPIVFPADSLIAVCWSDSIQIGIPLPDSVSIVWTGKGLSCQDCGQPWFFQENTGQDIENHVLTSTELWPGGCEIMTEYVVSVYPKPGLITDQKPLCLGDTISLVTTSGSEWSWEGPAIVPGAGQIAQVHPQVSATYIVTIKDEAGCETKDTAFVTVVDLPVIQDQFVFCKEEVAQLKIEAIPDVTYFWKNAGNRLSNPNVPNPLILVKESFDFILVVNNGFCQKEAIVQALFLDSLQISGLPDSITVCIGDTIDLQLQPEAIFEWHPANAVICLDPGCGHVAIPVTEPLTLFVSGVDGNGCSGSAMVTIQPEDSVSVQLDTLSLCQGSTVELFGKSVSDAGWYCDTMVISSSCIQINCVLVILADTSLVELSDTICEGQVVFLFGEPLTLSGTYCRTTTGSSGCDSTVCLTLTVIPDPVADLASDLFLCAGDTAWILVELDPENTVFAWTDGWPDLERPVTPITTYVLILTDACGQPDSAVLVVDTWPPPIPDLGPDTTFCQDSFYLLQPLLPEGTISWMWSDSFPQLERPVSEEGWYTLLVTDSCGQTGVDSVFLASAFCGPCEWDIPNVFTPNSDGVNDVFRVYKNCEAVIHMQIYNRWGQIVFDETGPDPMWNGIARGVDQPMEVYAYVITLSWTEQDREVRRGDVTLVR